MSLLFSTGAIAGSAAKGAPGMVLLTPTSIAHSGTSASIGANGQVTFTAVTSLSLNGVFSADFDNYVVSVSGTIATSSNLTCRLRAAGTDASGSDYTRQYLEAGGASVSAGRQTSQTSMLVGPWYSTAPTGMNLLFYGPYLAQPTAQRGVSVLSLSSAYIQDWCHTHSLSTSYDGVTFIISNAITGALQVYGVRS